MLIRVMNSISISLRSLGLLTAAAPTRPLAASTAAPHVAPKATPGPNTQAVHAERRLQLLKALRHYGHLRTNEVALALYPDAAYGQQLAQRLVRKAITAGLVLPRRNTLGGNSVVLAEGGVAALELAGLSARHGRDIVGVAGATFLHRMLATQYLLNRARNATAFGEYAIVHGLAPITREGMVKRFLKVSDGLVSYSIDQGPVVDAVEVEQSAKPMSELAGGVLRWAEFVGSTLAGPGSATVHRLVVVFDGSQGHAKRLLRAARERWGHRPQVEQQTLLRRVVLASADVGPGMTWRGCQERTLAAWAASSS